MQIMRLTTVAKTALTASLFATTVIQFHGVIAKTALGGGPLTAPLTSFITPTPTQPLTSPITVTPTPTNAPLTTPEQIKSTFTVKGKHIDQNGNPINLTGLGVTIYGPNSNAAQSFSGNTFESPKLSAGTYRLAVTTPTTQPDGTVYDVFYSMCGNCTQHDSFLLYSEHIVMNFAEGAQSSLGNYDNYESFVFKYVARPKNPQQGGNNGGGNNGGSNNGGSNNGGGNSSNNGGSNGGGVCNAEQPKSAPLLLTARASGANQVTLTWQRGWAPYDGFVISYGTKKGVTQFTTTVGNTTIATISGLNANAIYYFRIQAKNGCKTGGYSRELSVRTYGKIIATNVLGKTNKKKATPKVTKAVKSVSKKTN